MATQVQQVRPTYEQLEAQVADLQRQLAESREQQNERPQELTEALEKQTAVARILHISSRSPTHLQPVFAAIVEDAARLCGATSAAICFLRDGQLSVAKAYPSNPSIAPGAAADLPAAAAAIAEQALTEGRTLHSDDLAKERAHGDSASAAGNPLAHSGAALVAPLLWRERTVGALVVAWDAPHPRVEKHVTLLETFAAHASVAMENDTLIEEIEQRNRELSEALEQQTATTEILQVIASNPADLQPVLGGIAERVVRLCGASGAYVEHFTPRPDGASDYVAANAYAPGADSSIPEAERLPPFIARKVAAPHLDYLGPRAMQEKSVLHVYDAIALEARAAYPGSARRAEQHGLRTGVAVPLLHGDVAVGAIQAYRREVHPFSAREIALLETFAHQSVIAIENARLFQEIQDRNRELTEALEQQTATAEVLRVIASSPTDLPGVLNAVAESAVRVCGAEDAQIFRRNGEEQVMVAHFGPIVSSPVGHRRKMTRYPAAPSTRAMVEHRVVHTPNTAEEPTFPQPVKDVLARDGIAAFLAGPLLLNGEAIGSLLIRRSTPGPFTDQQIKLIETFADQAVIAIENARLFRELHEQLEQQKATSDILNVIATAPTNLEQVLDTIAEAAAQLCESPEARIYRRDDGTLVVWAANSTLRSRSRVTPAENRRQIEPGWVAGRAVLNGQTIHVEDAMSVSDDEYSVTRALALRNNFHSLLVTPLVRDGVSIGAISVTRPEVRPFSPRQIALLETFARQAIIAIENTRLFQELQDRTRDLTRSVDELKALAEVTQAVSSTLDLQEVLARILSHAQRLSGSDGGVIFEYDEAADEFHLRSAEQLDDALAAALRAIPLRLGQGAVGRAAEMREPVQVADILAEGAYQSHLLDALVQAGYRALLAVPLLREEHVLGGLVLNRKAPGEFAPEVVALMETFASQSALAIQNARLFREIEEKSRLLEEASRHKSQFLANMSHELRTPLNAILGYTELIVDGIYGYVPEKLLEVLDRVQKSGQHLLGLINAVLDLSKIEAGQVVLSLNDYSLKELVQTVFASVESLAAAKGLQLQVEMAPDLPVGRGDDRRLSQVLLNLAGNAIKFTDAGAVTIRVTARDGQFVVSVADTGPGIAESDQQRIFDEFQQADGTATRQKGGTGLGLAIARRIVEMHGGRICVESAPGQGATFTFTVPVRVEREAGAS